MRRIVNKTLCYGLAIILLMFGLNIDEAKSMFYTPNVLTEGRVSLQGGHEVILQGGEMAATEIMEIRSNSPVQQLVKQYSANRKDGRNLYCIFILNDYLAYYTNSVMAVFMMDENEIHQKIAVINYIHDLDGKKRV